MDRERRQFQRLPLDGVVDARLDEIGVRILELGIVGARLEHSEPLPSGPTLTLQFDSAGEKVMMECVVIRSVRSAPGVFETGLRFSRALGESDVALRRILFSEVKTALQTRTLRRLPPLDDRDAEDTFRGKDAGFVTYRMHEGEWRKTPSILPDQPEAGFTVAAGEDEEEIDLLCRAYEEADSEGMRLIRMFAELSVSEAIGMPPRKE